MKARLLAGYHFLIRCPGCGYWGGSDGASWSHRRTLAKAYDRRDEAWEAIYHYRRKGAATFLPGQARVVRVAVFTEGGRAG
jgi:hypothetical protein